jgi:hypothetical protein
MPAILFEPRRDSQRHDGQWKVDSPEADQKSGLFVTNRSLGDAEVGGHGASFPVERLKYVAEKEKTKSR